MIPKASSRDVRLDVSFESTVQNKSPQPCDLNGFMDYLYYVERRAEILQFFLWFCDYVERWSRLPPSQTRAAPVWGPDEAARAAREAEAEAAPVDADVLSTTPPTTPLPAFTPNRHRAHHSHSHSLGHDYSHGHSRGPSASSNYRHHRSYSHSHVHGQDSHYSHYSHHSHHRARSTETVPYRARSNSMASVATAASVSSLASAALPRVSIHQRADNERLASVMALLAGWPAVMASASASSVSASALASELEAPSPREPTDWCLHYQKALLHEQPLRDEMDRVVALYIASGGARALSDNTLLAPERAACLRAAKKTTHPSALLPVFFAADAALREQAFPAFVRAWCVSNVARGSARWAVSAACALLLFVLGVGVQVLLVHYAHSNALRLLSLVLWWPALVLAALALYGIDIVLYVRAQRLLRPWEGGPAGECDIEKGTTQGSIPLRPRRPHRPTGSVTSTSSAAAPAPRTARLQALGPRNDPDSEAWMQRHKTMPWHKRVLSQLWPGRTAAVQHKHVRAMQRRAVWTAVVGAWVVSAVLNLGLLFIPVT